MKKRRKKPQPIDPGAALLHDIMEALMTAQGRGGLTWLTQKLGMSSPSAMRKRMASPTGAFDPVTLRGSLLALACKSERATGPVVATSEHGRFIVDLHQAASGAITPAWRPK